METKYLVFAIAIMLADKFNYPYALGGLVAYCFLGLFLDWLNQKVLQDRA